MYFSSRPPQMVMWFAALGIYLNKFTRDFSEFLDLFFWRPEKWRSFFPCIENCSNGSNCRTNRRRAGGHHSQTWTSLYRNQYSWQKRQSGGTYFTYLQLNISRWPGPQHQHGNILSDPSQLILVRLIFVSHSADLRDLLSFIKAFVLLKPKISLTSLYWLTQLWELTTSMLHDWTF